MGFKIFSNNTTLTAEDVNDYLMEQGVLVFDDATQRTNELSTPQEGMVAYLKTTNDLSVYDGSSWVAVTTAATPNAASYLSAAGFPVVATDITAETVIDRIIVPPAPFARRIQVTGNAYFVVTVGGTVVNYFIQAGTSVLARCRVHQATANAEGLLAATGSMDLAAGAGATLDVVVSRFSGTGAIRTSTSSGFTRTTVLTTRI